MKKHNKVDRDIYILGISYGFVATAVLMKNGNVIACASEERFTNKKNQVGLPVNAIDYCLREAEISSKDLSLVTTPYTIIPPSHFSIDDSQKDPTLIGKIISQTALLRKTFRYMRYHLPFLNIISKPMYKLSAAFIEIYYTPRQRREIAGYLNIDETKVKSYDHHLSHAASGYYCSPFNKEEALVVTLDGEGDNFSGSVSIFNGEDYKVLSRISRENSLGYIYGYLTKYLGMKPHEHEYKVMGLAPYAKDIDVERVYKKIENHIYTNPQNKLEIGTAINAQDYEFFLQSKMRYVRFDHIAGAYQKLIEEKVSAWIQGLIEHTGIKTIVLSGGVFMNVKLNQVVASLDNVEKLFVLPSCGDETAPLGSNFLAYIESCRKSFVPNAIKGLYWGPSFTNEDIKKELEKGKKYRYTYIQEIEEEIAKLLHAGETVAHMAGRMEFGARALGNRSILANPKNQEVIKVINEQVKNRDFWMPFAPSIKFERFNDYAVNPRDIDSPYMIMAYNSTARAIQELKAALHPYDDTMRPQTVKREVNEKYHKIITEFERLSGIGGVLNTSFNLHGYPIVQGPKEALWVFENSGLKYLVMENYLITKETA